MKQLIHLIVLLISVISFAQEINQVDANGARHGVWQKYYPDTKILRYQGQFNHGKEVGEFKFYKKVNNKALLSATKQFTSQDSTAYTSFYGELGNVISEGKMVGKKYVGLWKYYHKNSKQLMTLETYNKNGKLEGERTTYYPDGKIAEQQLYVNGELHGVSKIYTKNEVLLNVNTYKSGKLHGISKSFNGNGQLLAEGNYKNNYKDGIWKFYKDNKLVEEKDFTKKSNNPYLKKE